jgi:hypothetical protein
MFTLGKSFALYTKKTVFSCFALLEEGLGETRYQAAGR